MLPSPDPASLYLAGMPAPVSIPGLAVGQRVQGTFLVLEVELHTPETANPFTVLRLGNHTGTIPSEPFWLDRAGEIAGLRRGHMVQVIGEVTEYRERRQLRITSIRALPAGTVDPRTLLPSVGPVERYWETLDGWRREIAKPRLARVLALFFEDDDFRRAYEQCPAAVHGHHAALGGLLKHTTEVAAIARTIARTCGADWDLVLAGTLLHDIGKLEAYRWDALLDHTDAGRLLGHVALGALMLDRRLNEQREPPCTALERDLLLHIVLAHHGKLEFGSPVQPMLLEAEVLHWADNASAKTASLAEALADAANFADGFVSRPVWALDRRRVFRGVSDWGAGGA
jgi:3'-5' exoribonuclease